MSGDLRAVYLCSSGSWAATLAEPTAIPPCPAGSIMLVADPDIPWPTIVGATINLKKRLLADGLELNGFPEVPSVRSAA